MRNEAPSTAEYEAFYRDKAELEKGWSDFAFAVGLAAIWAMPRSSFLREQLAEDMAHRFPADLMKALDEAKAKKAEGHTAAIEKARDHRPAELVVMKRRKPG